MSENLTLSTIAKKFQDEEEAYLLVEGIRWPEGPICPHCGSIDHAMFLTPKNGHRTTRTGKVSYRRLWKCSDCREQFSVLVGTIFEDSKIPLSKWLLGIHMLCAGKNGVAALELSRQLNIAYRSAWFSAHRIRYAMQQEPLASMLTGTVEVDETYVGGRSKKRPGQSRTEAAKQALDKKTPVVTLVQRDGELRSQVMPRVTGANIKQLLSENVSPEATLMSDEAKVYVKQGREFADHQTVAHKKDEYVRGDAHINTAEGFFSQLKRSIDGTHHHVSAEHLHRYVSEFDYRYNSRKMHDGDRTTMTIQRTAGKRLMYKEPITPDGAS